MQFIKDFRYSVYVVLQICIRDSLRSVYNICGYPFDQIGIFPHVPSAVYLLI